MYQQCALVAAMSPFMSNCFVHISFGHDLVSTCENKPPARYQFLEPWASKSVAEIEAFFSAKQGKLGRSFLDWTRGSLRFFCFSVFFKREKTFFFFLVVWCVKKKKGRGDGFQKDQKGRELRTIGSLTAILKATRE